MKRLAVILANGTEEIEGLTPVDVLRRAGVECDTVSVSGEFIKGSHGIVIKADKVADSVDFNVYDGIVIPGGMPGATNISNSKYIVSAIKSMVKSGKLVAAICASPAVVLADNGLLNADKATCYPAPNFINSLNDKYTGDNVTVCGNVITANGPKSAMEFSLAICAYLGVTAKF